MVKSVKFIWNISCCSLFPNQKSFAIFVLLLASSQFLCHVVNAQPSFEKEFMPTWGFDHVTTSSNGQTLLLTLDNSSGSSFASKRTFFHGNITMQMKLVHGDSAGVVVAYYMASQNMETRDEIDFEFLGNTSGQPYVLQTNVFTHGIGGREQRMYLWFDPSEDFHAYSFLWNQDHVVFMVDNVPIREFKNLKKKFGIPYLDSQVMGVFSSIWNGEQWATQGGQIKTNWTYAPFVATYNGFNLDACDASSLTSNISCERFKDSSSIVIDMPKLQWVKQNFIIYDYCTDSRRYPSPPPECSFNP